MLSKRISSLSRIAIIFGVWCLACVPALAGGAPAHSATKSSAVGPQASRHATPPAMQEALRDMFNVHAISEAVISPDGRRVAWVESLSGKNGAPSSNSAIRVADWRSHSTPLRITAATGGAAAAESNVAWSPDSKRLAFLSDATHSGQLQLYVAAPGVPARQLTHVKGDLSNPAWSPDGKSIAFLFI
ncbi:MAG TPA: hypothetical protein VMV59_06780, partial [Candidatus Dormibacteraeota bacterium]|nr:hypothetical protein [Candidatus Dormibacteraeota bacterium]